MMSCPPPPSRRSQRGFTLVEIMVACLVFSILMGFFFLIISGVQFAWIRGEQKVEISQNGRAVLEILSRELAPALASGRIQFVQTPNLAGKISNLAPNAPSLFWASPGPGHEKGNLCEFGYYLTRNSATQTYNLNRFYVTPDNSNSYYLLPTAYELESTSARRPYSFANSALWITRLSNNAFDPANSTSVVSVVAEGVVAMWIRCLDPAGNPIPWLSQASSYGYSSGTIQYSSAAAFQMTGKGAEFNDGRTFRYTQGPSSTSATPVTALAHRLPSSVEITLVIVDSKSLARKPNIPPMPEATTPEEIPAQIEAFNRQLSDAGIKTARTFTTRVRLLNAL